MRRFYRASPDHITVRNSYNTETPMKRSLFIICLVVAATSDAAFGATFSVSPSVVTNDRATQISLDVTGLTTGSTVRLEKYMDLNGNGVIDPSDHMVQSFSVTDG